MPKEFYTEKDIEDLVKRGQMSLVVNEQVSLTDLAYEKARRLGLKLVSGAAENPPAAPVRPYLSQAAASQPARAAPAAPVPSQNNLELSQRIRAAVIARLGSQVDPNLLDVIIKRVIESTGVK